MVSSTAGSEAPVANSPQLERPNTLGKLRESGYTPRPVREEMRTNLISKLKAGDDLFEGVWGYDDSVVPQVINAILSQHDFILLGLRGQAKTRILRQLSSLLDEAIPILAGSEVNDDPFAPISRFGRLLLDERGEDAPIEWIGREQRYVEKLATPDVTIADVIGDIDPIRAARGGRVLADELNIHWGLLPRANRGIFAINELPDLAAKIQVGLFNVLQEGDVQVKGYPVRLALDVMAVFTANPEDYTARGKIVTPLKDRIGVEVRTHYPEEVEVGMAITAQEAWLQRSQGDVDIPDFVAECVERVAAIARADRRVDQHSGVSQRLPITLLETVVSNAERRALARQNDDATPRITDLYAGLPAITGKLEWEYEGELHGASKIARELVQMAAAFTFEVRAAGADVDGIVEYFETGGALQLSEDADAAACVAGFGTVPGLLDLVRGVGLAPKGCGDGRRVAACELVLEALVAQRRISRTSSGYAKPPRKEREHPDEDGSDD